MLYKIYITYQVGYNEYESKLYASYTDDEQASDIAFYLQSQGINARIIIEDEEDLN